MVFSVLAPPVGGWDGKGVVALPERRGSGGFSYAVLLAGLVMAGESALARQELEARRWAGTFWSAWGADGEIEDFPGVTSQFIETWFAGFGLSREFARSGRYVGWEVEANLVKHFGWQTHVEGDLAVVLRWDGLRWGDRLEGSVAIAEGLSQASRVPAMEAELGEVNTRLLNFLAVEIDFARVESPANRLVLRLHHRSGAFGTFDGTFGGSNFYVLGLRRRF